VCVSNTCLSTDPSVYFWSRLSLWSRFFVRILPRVHIPCGNNRLKNSIHHECTVLQFSSSYIDSFGTFWIVVQFLIFSSICVVYRVCKNKSVHPRGCVCVFNRGIFFMSVFVILLSISTAVLTCGWLSVILVHPWTSLGHQKKPKQIIDYYRVLYFTDSVLYICSIRSSGSSLGL